MKCLKMTWEVLDFREEGSLVLNFSQALKNSKSELTSRINKAFGSASDKPFFKENLRRVTRWLHFWGLVVFEPIAGGEPTLAQQIVQYLRNEALHEFRFRLFDGSIVVLKGLLLLVAIAHLYVIRIVVFSTRRHKQRMSHSCIPESSGLNIVSRSMVSTWFGSELKQTNSYSTCKSNHSNGLPACDPKTPE